MAPRKRKAEQQEQPNTTSSARVTRSVTNRAAANSSASPPELQVQKKKVKKGKAAEKGKQKEKPEPKNDAEGTETVEKTNKREESSGNADGAANKTIIIERCTQCRSFKERADKVKGGLEEKVPGITVIVNPEKPRRGCFEIREERGEKFISLLDMKRPFKAMKELDMDQVISDVIDKIN